jgi:hypothetical protein
MLVTRNLQQPKTTGCGSYDPGISDHHVIHVVLDIATPQRYPKLIKKLICENDVALHDAFNKFPWHVLDVFDDINDTRHYWEKTYSQILNDHFKEVTLKIRVHSKPWMNTEIRKELNKRYQLLCKAQKTAKGSLEWQA